MNEKTKTLVFVAVAAVSVGIAALSDSMSKPSQPPGFEQVGKEFYEEFTDPTEATDLRVVAYNADKAEIKAFNVVLKDGVWIIPSHHNYPADGESRLAETASSIIGIVRGALITQRKSDHENYGVIDPLDDQTTSLIGRGNRITLSKEGGTVLADYIIGNKVENQQDEYYVRSPDDNKVYRTKLKINLSTKFQDWIEPDLLKLNKDDLTDVVINKYSIDERQRRLVGQEVSELSRETSADDWKLKGLDEKTEELNNDDINTLVGKLDDLKIVGIREKPAGLSQDLKLSQEIKVDAPTFLELQSKGFLIVADQDGNQLFVSNEGELTASTNAGIIYTLHFGEIFSGSDTEIEIGGTSSEATPEKQADDKEDAESDESTDGDLNKSRYLFVRVDFDEKLIGPALTKPEKPEKPVAAKKPTPKKDVDEKPKTEKPADTKDEKKPADKEEQPAEEKAKDEPAEKKKDSDEVAYEEAVTQYEIALLKYQDDVKAREEKIAAGKKTAQELTERFANWFYVISAESFENLRLARKDLVKPKEIPEEEKKEDEKPADKKAGPAKPEIKVQPKPKAQTEAKKPAAKPTVKPAAPAKKEEK